MMKKTILTASLCAAPMLALALTPSVQSLQGLDKNDDGRVSTQELSTLGTASRLAALREYDKNNNKELTEEELQKGFLPTKANHSNNHSSNRKGKGSAGKSGGANRGGGKNKRGNRGRN